MELDANDRGEATSAIGSRMATTKTNLRNMSTPLTDATRWVVRKWPHDVNKHNSSRPMHPVDIPGTFLDQRKHKRVRKELAQGFVTGIADRLGDV